MTQQERNNEIEKLKWERECYMRYVDRIVKTIKNKKSPSRDFLIKAAAKILNAGFQIKQFEIRLYRIISTPIPKFPKGGVINNGLAIVGETGVEEILLPTRSNRLL